jgi:hypothetical protein
MARKQQPSLAVVEELADIPVFTSEAEEAAYWGTHTLSEQLLKQMQPLSEDDAPRPRKSRAISIRIDEGLLERLQTLADQAHRPYQSLLKQFLSERIELEESKAQTTTAVARESEILHTMLGSDLTEADIVALARLCIFPDWLPSLYHLDTVDPAKLAQWAITRCKPWTDNPFRLFIGLDKKVDDLTEAVARLSADKEGDHAPKPMHPIGTRTHEGS